jgi:hypothetical protein
MKLKFLNKEKIDMEIRNRVILTQMPDGENYFLGVKEVQMPTKHGTTHPVKFNVWTTEFERDVIEHEGIFTETEANFYLKEIIDMGGCYIDTYAEVAARRKEQKSN